MAKTLQIDVGPTGEVKIDAIGFTGKACEAATKIYTDALGGKPTDIKRKAEYNQTTSINAGQG